MNSPRVPETDETKVDESELLKEQEKVEALAQELKQAKAELAEKPKEVSRSSSRSNSNSDRH
ncbi:MAG: hypothetical protein ACOX3C_00170 [Bacilli bacterium]